LYIAGVAVAVADDDDDGGLTDIVDADTDADDTTRRFLDAVGYKEGLKSIGSM